MFLRPYLSESTPATGVRKTPGSVKKVMSRTTCPGEMPSSCTIVGKAGVTLEVPSTAISVTPQTTCRL